MLSGAEAWGRIFACVGPPRPETVTLGAAAGRVLAEDVVSDAALPPFDRAAMDGFAVRARDLTQVPARLTVCGEIQAGREAGASVVVPPGGAVVIMTGAPLPPGADTIVPVEHTRRSADGATVEILTDAQPGQHVAAQGSEVAQGTRVLARGRRLEAAAIAVLATVGRATIAVGRRPEVALVITGDELVDAGERPTGAHIRDANGPTLAALVQESGALVRDVRRVRDTPEDLAAALRAGLQADVLLVSGGVSAGRYDLVEPALLRLGVEPIFDSVAVKPGKPLVFARQGDTLVFGLPGNPVSAQVTFQLFVRPALLAWQGATAPHLRETRARLRVPLRNGSGRRAYSPALVDVVGDELLVEPLRSAGSADVVAHARAQALVRLEPDERELAAGSPVTILWLSPCGSEEVQR